VDILIIISNSRRYIYTGYYNSIYGRIINKNTKDNNFLERSDYVGACMDEFRSRLKEVTFTIQLGEHKIECKTMVPDNITELHQIQEYVLLDVLNQEIFVEITRQQY
jgi:hypothetical protein